MYTMQKSDHMVLKESIGYTLIKAGTQCKKSVHMVLKGVNGVHIDKIRSNGPERSQLCKQCKIRSYGVERSQLGTHC